MRPERITLTRNRPENTPNITPGLVEDVGYIGHMSAYRVRLADGRVIRVTQSNRLRDEDPISWDEQVFASWNPTAARILTE